ncbi:MAG: ABC transporter permease [Erysipelothrix sp.]|nr:ABC transporter permease [Erysipelothrix sp.]
MFFKLVVQQLRIFTRDKTALFWTSVFTIGLAILFKVALGDIGYSYKLDTMNIGYINQINSVQEFEQFDTTIQKIAVDGIKLFNVVTGDAENLLNESKVDALIDVSSTNFDVLVKEKGIKQTIITSVINSYQQNSKLISSRLQQDHTTNIEQLIDKLNTEMDIFVTQNNDHFDVSVMYFYTLIGMQCLYSYMWGAMFINQAEANLSTKGQRIQVSSVKKSTYLISGFVASVVLSFLQVVILLAFLILGLKVNFSDQIGQVLILVFVGVTTGVSFGTLIASSNTMSVNVKDGIGIGVTMLWSFLAGMMVVDLKHLIQINAPIINWLNPVALITDSLYGIYYYPTLERYYLSLGMLLLITLVFLTLSIFFTRRKQYDAL